MNHFLRVSAPSSEKSSYTSWLKVTKQSPLEIRFRGLCLVTLLYLKITWKYVSAGLCLVT